MNEITSAPPLRVRVRNLTAAAFRMRAGQRWSKDPREVEVVDAPANDGQISPSQFAMLESDPYIECKAVGGHDPQVGSIKAELVKREVEIAELRKQLGAAQEAARVERSALAGEVAHLGAQIVALESDLAAARAATTESLRKRK